MLKSQKIQSKILFSKSSSAKKLFSPKHFQNNPILLNLKSDRKAFTLIPLKKQYNPSLFFKKHPNPSQKFKFNQKFNSLKNNNVIKNTFKLPFNNNKNFYTKNDIVSIFNQPNFQGTTFSGPFHGLMDLPDFKSPSVLINRAQITKTEAYKLSEDIISAPVKPKEIVAKIDKLSELLCSTADPANFIRQIHPNRLWQNAAEVALNTISSCIHKLNTTPKLYQKVVEVWNQADELDEEEKTVIRQLKSEFELNGIHLPSNLRNRVVELQEEISKLGDMFINEMQSPQTSKIIRVPLKETRFRRDQEAHWKHLIALQNGDVTFSTNPHVLASITQTMPDERLRKEAFIASSYQFPNNVKIVNDLISARTQLAKLMNYPSASDMKTSVANNRCLRNPQQVYDFLNDISQKNRQKVLDELEILKEEKSRLTGEKDPQIYAWDKEFYIRQVKTKDENRLRKAREYFSVGAGFRGLQIICEKLFGIDLKVVPPQKGETWHPSVRKIEVIDEVEGLIGYVYADLFPRPGKLHQNATFNLEFPRANENGLYKIARLGLNCNFEGEPSTSKPNEPTLLSPTEMETLFHEFGHCLHSLFSRTRYQHAAGTRAPLDFVETPSTFMEFFVWDYRSVKEFAKHWQTGETLPEKDLNLLLRERNQFSGLYLQDQICFALFDQLLHAQNPESKTPSDIFFEILKEHSYLEPVREGHYYTRFSHLANYDTGYYCYPLCRAFSTNIWNSCFINDPLSRNAGMRYREKILKYGGSADPLLLIENLIGDKPNGQIYWNKI